MNDGNMAPSSLPDRRSIRLDGFDYRGTHSYFVTVCTHDRVPILGTINNNVIQLTPIGQMVADEWIKTPRIRPYVSLDEWIVMPDHFHGIITIHHDHRAIQRIAPTNGLASNSLGSIIGQWKSITAKRIRASGHPDFTWQRNYYDRIIRDATAHAHVQQYIRNNPKNWISKSKKMIPWHKK